MTGREQQDVMESFNLREGKEKTSGSKYCADDPSDPFTPLPLSQETSFLMIIFSVNVGDFTPRRQKHFNLKNIRETLQPEDIIFQSLSDINNDVNVPF
ncbi:hypothetical protein JOB18_026339 [Solea senegalensis]|uniref:Uncharacterized protein n=1 Tax=Solea senegalensis TaxID=28829 RepID=A0AAV6PJL3_SOLSE|nr:hypothetical protein JOB18_026339 [Solea senegalensis]